MVNKTKSDQEKALPSTSMLARLDALLDNLNWSQQSIDKALMRENILAALRDSEQHLHVALEAGRMGTWEWVVATGRVNWSPGLETMHGLEPGTFKGTFEAFLSDVHPEDRPCVSERIAQALANCTDHHIEYRLLLKDGTIRWVETCGKVFCNPQGHPERLIGVCADISRRKRDEEERHEILQREQAARSELERANHAKDNFLAVLSHELRTPLTPVLATAQMMESDPAFPAQVRELATMIRRNVELEARLIDDLLDVTKISRGKIILHRTCVNVHEKIKHVVEINREEIAAKKIEVILQLEADAHFVEADKARLQQVMWNLLKNAVKFTPNAGRVTIKTSNADGQSVSIEVKDTGIGIAPENLPRIFGAFDRAVAPQFGGLGLGLAISKTLVELHGGRVHVASDGIGKGAVFTIELPTKENSSVTPIENALPKNSVVGCTILLVEDHPDTRNIMTRLLADMGCTVVSAGTVAQALELADQKSFQLLISDIGLPDASGMKLMREIKARHGIKGLALSGYGMDEDIQACKDAGFAAHLTKPINVQALEQLVRELTQ